VGASVEILLIIATLVMIALAITGYDQYIATKVRLKTYSLVSRSALTGGTDGMIESDPATKMRIKKVKAVKVGSYLVVTLVIGDGRKGEEIEVDDPSLLIPLMGLDEEAEAKA